MTTWRSHVATGVLTLAAGSIALALWWGVERERSPRLGRVDIGQIVDKQPKSLEERVKPGIDAQEQGRIFEDANAFGNRLDAACLLYTSRCV